MHQGVIKNLITGNRAFGEKAPRSALVAHVWSSRPIVTNRRQTALFINYFDGHGIRHRYGAAAAEISVSTIGHVSPIFEKDMSA